MDDKKKINIIVCGSRFYSDYNKILDELKKYSSMDVTIIEGECSGADKLAAKAAKELKYTLQKFPAQWEKYGKAAGPIRNKKMIDAGHPNLILAFHPNIDESRGTKNMIAQASACKIKVKIIK